jgi:hypothetical protein
MIQRIAAYSIRQKQVVQIAMRATCGGEIPQT